MQPCRHMEITIMQVAHPYLLFLGDVPDQLAAKTAMGIVDWRRDWCLGQNRLTGCKAETGLPDLSLQEAREKGAKTLVVGAVNSGGVLPEHWVETIVAALNLGMDVASGLHSRLCDIPAIRQAAEDNQCQLHDIRHPARDYATGKGKKRSGLRLLTVGTDCSAGKKYTALAMEQAMREAGMKADFRATGQTGLLISGRGVAIDAVAADFISGAVEWVAPKNEPDHWDVIEGQGSLYHPAFAGVSLGLLHGAQADAFIVCHEPGRTTMRGVETPLPSIQEVIDLTIACGKRTNPAIRCIGLSIYTAKLDDTEARTTLEALSREHGLPATDPLRYGCAPLVEAIQQNWSA